MTWAWTLFLTMTLGCVVSTSVDGHRTGINGSATSLESASLKLSFDPATGLLARVENKLIGEELPAAEDDFRIEAADHTITRATSTFQSMRHVTPNTVESTYRSQDGSATVIATYTLGPDRDYFEKTLALQSSRPLRWKSVVISHLKIE